MWAVMVIESSIGNALFTKTQQRVLGFLFGNVERSYYLNELVERAGMGKGTVRRELEKLRAAGIVQSRKVGNQLHYQANLECPVFDELQRIVNKTSGAASMILSALEPCRNDLEMAFVYGSVANGSERTGSDIDLMLVGEGLDFSGVLRLLLPVTAKLEREINPTVFSPSEFQERVDRGQGFLMRVLARDKIWLLGEDRLSRYTEGK